MRTFAVVASLLMSAGVASAATLPIAGAYGDSYGCRVAIQGDEDTTNADWNPDWILVTPGRAIGHEWACSFQSTRNRQINASCANAGDQPQRQIIVADEHRLNGTLTYIDAAGTFTLHRCR